MGPPWGAFCQITLTSCLFTNGTHGFHLKLVKLCVLHQNACILMSIFHTSCNARPPVSKSAPTASPFFHLRCLPQAGPFWCQYSHTYSIRPASVRLVTYGASILMSTAFALFWSLLAPSILCVDTLTLTLTYLKCLLSRDESVCQVGPSRLSRLTTCKEHAHADT